MSDEIKSALIASIAHDLIEVISWDSTEQGYDYWRDVYNKLNALSKAEYVKENTSLPSKIMTGENFKFTEDWARNGDADKLFIKVDLRPALRDYDNEECFMDPLTSEVFVFNTFDRVIPV
jgi:hypothetical protein